MNCDTSRNIFVPTSETKFSFWWTAWIALTAFPQAISRVLRIPILILKCAFENTASRENLLNLLFKYPDSLENWIHVIFPVVSSQGIHVVISGWCCSIRLLWPQQSLGQQKRCIAEEIFTSESKTMLLDSEWLLNRIDNSRDQNLYKLWSDLSRCGFC